MLYLRPVDLSVDEVLGETVRAVSEIGARRVVINGLSGSSWPSSPASATPSARASIGLSPA